MLVYKFIIIFLLSIIFWDCQSNIQDQKDSLYEIATHVSTEDNLISKIDSVTKLIESGDEKQKLIRGYLYYMIGDWENARNDFKETLQNYPNNSYVLTGFAALVTISNTDSAVKYINEAIRVDRNNSLAYCRRSLIQENYQNKIADLDTAIKIDPKCSMYYSLRGLFYHDIDSIKQAKRDFKSSIELNRPYPLSFSMLGMIYEEKGEYNDALNMYTEMINRTVIKRPGYKWRGDIFHDLGKYSTAIEEYKKASISYKGKLDNSSSDDKLYYSISQNYSLLNEKDSCYKYLNLALNTNCSYGRLLIEEKNFNNVKNTKWFTDFVNKYSTKKP